MRGVWRGSRSRLTAEFLMFSHDGLWIMPCNDLYEVLTHSLNYLSFRGLDQALSLCKRLPQTGGELNHHCLVNGLIPEDRN